MYSIDIHEAGYGYGAGGWNSSFVIISCMYMCVYVYVYVYVCVCMCAYLCRKGIIYSVIISISLFQVLVCIHNYCYT